MLLNPISHFFGSWRKKWWNCGMSESVWSFPWKAPHILKLTLILCLLCAHISFLVASSVVVSGIYGIYSACCTHTILFFFWIFITPFLLPPYWPTVFLTLFDPQSQLAHAGCSCMLDQWTSREHDFTKRRPTSLQSSVLFLPMLHQYSLSFKTR